MSKTSNVIRPLLVAAVLLAGVSAGCDSRPPPPSSPNVLMIIMDTTRGDRCSVNGYGRPTTPGLERLAKEGVVYTDAWSPSSWTLPAHASLFTGHRPENHGAIISGRYYLDESAVTLAELLRDAGYATSCFSCNAMVGDEFGLVQGFETHETNPRIATDFPPTAPWASGRVVEAVRAARDEGKPWFVFVNNWEPHLNYDPPPEDASRFLPADTPKRLVAESREFMATTDVLFSFSWREIGTRQWSVLSDLYDAEIASLDRVIGELLDELRGTGALDNTMVVVAADHGENLGDHGLCGHVFSLHRSLLHVPLVVRYPGGDRGGSRIGDTVRLEDVFPTVLEVAGRPVPPDIDGVSLLAPLEGRVSRAILGGSLAPQVWREYPAFAESPLWRRIRSVYDGRHHLIQWFDGAEEMFDTRADPLEKRNLLPAAEEAATHLRALLPEFR